MATLSFRRFDPLEVREITPELIEFIEIRMQEGIATAQAEGNIQAGLALIEAMPNVARAKWGENNGYRGNTLLGLEPIARALSIAQSNGMNYGLELWALSRQMHREVTVSARPQWPIMQSWPMAEHRASRCTHRRYGKRLP